MRLRKKTIRVNCVRCGREITIHLKSERINEIYSFVRGVKHYFTMETTENEIKESYNLCDECDDT